MVATRITALHINKGKMVPGSLWIAQIILKMKRKRGMADCQELC